MSIAEALLRLGAALVAWLCLYAWVLWLATLRVISCAADGDHLWAVLFGFASAMLPLAGLTRATRPLDDIHSLLGWFRWPLLILALLAIPPLLSAWLGSTLDSQPVCPSAAPAAWHFWWAPAQTVVMLGVAVILWRSWR
ncbi:MAG: hypothetical protein R3E84_14665 [Pseudomonadales bacterium]